MGGRPRRGTMASSCAASLSKTKRWNCTKVWSRTPHRLARTIFVAREAREITQLVDFAAFVVEHDTTWHVSTTIHNTSTVPCQGFSLCATDPMYWRVVWTRVHVHGSERIGGFYPAEVEKQLFASLFRLLWAVWDPGTLVWICGTVFVADCMQSAVGVTSALSDVTLWTAGRVQGTCKCQQLHASTALRGANQQLVLTNGLIVAKLKRWRAVACERVVQTVKFASSGGAVAQV